MPAKLCVSEKSAFTNNRKSLHYCVKYNNYLNTIPLTSFTAQDYDTFMTICAKIKGCDTNQVTITFKEMREMMNFHETTTVALVNAFQQLYRKMVGVVCTVKSGQYTVGFNIFHSYGIDEVNKIFTVSANKEFKYIFNDFSDGFTWFGLDDFTRLRSKYDKALYRLLCQYRTTGLYVVKIDVFRQLMDFPAGMPNKKMVQQLKSSVKSLQDLLPDLAFETYKGASRSSGIVALKFTFRKSKAKSDQQTVSVNPSLINPENKPDSLTMNEFAELVEIKSHALEDSAENVVATVSANEYSSVEETADSDDPYERLIRSDTL